MAEAKMKDYLSVVAPDYNATLSVTPQKTLIEVIEKDQVVHILDSTGEVRISFDDTPMFLIQASWPNGITIVDAGTIFDWYADSTKANGLVRSFKWLHVDAETYIVRFATKFLRQWTEGMVLHQQIQQLTLKVLGIPA